ncbi:MAG: Uma2 family endonuclease, partial [Gluconacetobacter diazotrophicus]|nr:Uma2 family endonuclease [Gluconacetobacter diazotrophicus]
MTVALRRTMTPDEFLDWAGTQNERYEFDGFRPVAMTGGSGNHARIARNIAFELGRRLSDDGPCEALSADAGIRTLGDAVRYPDALVTCTPFDGRGRLVPEPVIVFEVISPSSIREDRILKPVEYAAVPTIRRYVLVEQSVIGLTVLWRDQD